MKKYKVIVKHVRERSEQVIEVLARDEADAKARALAVYNLDLTTEVLLEDEA